MKHFEIIGEITDIETIAVGSGIRLRAIAKQRHVKRRFAICVRSDDPDLLTPRMVYEVLPDEGAAKSDYVRVIDNEGEDYLYPADYFVLVSFPSAVEHALVRFLLPVTENLSGDSKSVPDATPT